jgi:hypothetical protein
MRRVYVERRWMMLLYEKNQAPGSVDAMAQVIPRSQGEVADELVFFYMIRMMEIEVIVGNCRWQLA